MKLTRSPRSGRLEPHRQRRPRTSPTNARYTASCYGSHRARCGVASTAHTGQGGPSVIPSMSDSWRRGHSASLGAGHCPAAARRRGSRPTALLYLCRTVLGLAVMRDGPKPRIKSLILAGTRGFACARRAGQVRRRHIGERGRPGRRLRSGARAGGSVCHVSPARRRVAGPKRPHAQRRLSVMAPPT